MTKYSTFLVSSNTKKERKKTERVKKRNYGAAYVVLSLAVPQHRLDKCLPRL